MYLIELYPEEKHIEKIVQLNKGQEGIKAVGKSVHIVNGDFIIVSDLIQYIRKMPSFPSKTTTYHSKWIPAYAGMTDFTFLLCIGLNQ